MNLLILEDSRYIAQAVQSSLAKAFPKVGVQVASSIAEAEGWFQREPADIMIVDVQLPDGNGIDFLDDVREVYPTIPAIIMTAHSVADMRSRAENMGVTQFLEKPVTPSALRDCVTQALNSVFETPMLSREELEELVSSIPILDFIQLKCLAQRTCMLLIDNGFEAGRLYIHGGRLTHAETRNTIGIPALAEMIDWPSCTVTAKTAELATYQSIGGDWVNAITQACDMAVGSNEMLTLAFRD
jgi:DNA-binding NarL/FixJ family response regulator